jgi:hypothetical protein
MASDQGAATKNQFEENLSVDAKIRGCKGRNDRIATGPAAREEPQSPFSRREVSVPLNCGAAYAFLCTQSERAKGANNTAPNIKHIVGSGISL